VTPAPPREASSTSTAQALVGPAAAVAAAAAVAGCLLVRDPNDAGAYPLCPFRALTGWDCPGCGALRGLRALVGGDVAVAVDQNLLLVAAVPFLLWRWFSWTRSRVRAEPSTGWAVPAPVLYTLLAITCVFWVLRNLPGVPLLPSGIG
jgi:hypothetical protein